MWSVKGTFHNTDTKMQADIDDYFEKSEKL